MMLDTNAANAEHVIILRSALEKLRDELDELACNCTAGSFIYNCQKCRIRDEIIDPALEATQRRGT